MNEKEILKDYDEKKLKVEEILKKYGIKRNAFFNLIKKERPFNRRIRRQKSNYHQELMAKAEEYWKSKDSKPPKDSLAWVLVPEFGEEFAREFLKVRAYIKKHKGLLKLLEEKD